MWNLPAQHGQLVPVTPPQANIPPYRRVIDQLTVPPVVHQPALLRRLTMRGAVDADVILRQEDAALQLGRVRVGRRREVNEPAVAPVLVPALPVPLLDGGWQVGDALLR